jgi:hypothetical protein
MKKADNFNISDWLMEMKINRPNPKDAKQVLHYYLKKVDIFNPEGIRNHNELENALNNDQDFKELNATDRKYIQKHLRGRLQYDIDMER